MPHHHQNLHLEGLFKKISKKLMNCGILEINLLINSEENVHLLFLSKKNKALTDSMDSTCACTPTQLQNKSPTDSAYEMKCVFIFTYPQ